MFSVSCEYGVHTYMIK